MMSVKVSIVIPCYNRAELIGAAIESALHNGDGAEVIVVDDGSTDASWDRIRSFGERVRGLRIPNGGVSAARNIGFNRASGDFIKFLDSDDQLPPGGMTALKRAQEMARPHEIVFGDARSIGPDGEAISSAGYGYADAAPPGPLSRETFLSRIMSPYLPLYPVGALRQVGGFDPAYSLGEDQELAVRLILAGYTFKRIPAIVAEVREHPGERLSRANDAALHDRHIDLFTAIIRHVDAASPPLSSGERNALATMIWTVARDAARARHRAQAMRLFALATKLTGPVAAAPRTLRPLYRYLPPYRVEQLVEFAKKLVNRRG
jgi:glycosyltransferase involved in cell wall biosynthesis